MLSMSMEKLPYTESGFVFHNNNPKLTRFLGFTQGFRNAVLRSVLGEQKNRMHEDEPREDLTLCSNSLIFIIILAFNILV